MRAEFVFRIFDKHINQLIRVCKQCPPEKRSVIPEGFINNMHWHLGHLLVITEYDVLTLSDQPCILPESYKSFFAYGSKPADWKEEPPEWDILISKLKELRNHVHDVLQDRLDEPVKENLLHAQTISELIYLTAMHMSYHQGIVYGMMRSLDSKVTEPQAIASDTAIFAGGCFWHMEEVFQQLEGVSNVYTGYTGGRDTNPTYLKVVSNTTDHLESVEVHFNPNEITYEELLQVFWSNIDPTAGGHDGDRGNEHQSAIFYMNNDQKELAEVSLHNLREAKRFGKPIATKIAAATTFYKAEDEHQNFYEKTRSATKYRMSEFNSGRGFYFE